MNLLLRCSAGALALGFPLLIAAQDRAALSAVANARATSLRYQSTFADYKPYQDVSPGDWRALNDAVRESGDGPMDMGSMTMDHGMSMPAAVNPAQRNAPPSMHMGGSHSMPRTKPADKARTSAPRQMHGDHAMPEGTP